MPEKQLTDESVFTELCEKGFCVLSMYLPQNRLQVLRNAIRRIHPTWSDSPPNKIPPLGQLPTESTLFSRWINFPFQESCFNEDVINPDIITPS